jgi:hypothetical protein
MEPAYVMPVTATPKTLLVTRAPDSVVHDGLPITHLQWRDSAPRATPSRVAADRHLRRRTRPAARRRGAVPPATGSHPLRLWPQPARARTRPARPGRPVSGLFPGPDRGGGPPAWLLLRELRHRPLTPVTWFPSARMRASSGVVQRSPQPRHRSQSNFGSPRRVPRPRAR